jgi:hypothetical protein
MSIDDCFTCPVHGITTEGVCGQCEATAFVAYPIADPLGKIIEAAYHCAWHNHEVHAAIKAAGLDEISDESIACLLGQYAESIKG